MANRAAMGMKRKDHDFSSHEFSIFLQPKRTRSQDAGLQEMIMEEERTSISVAINVPSMASWLPLQGQEAHGRGMEDTTCGGTSSARPVRAEEAAAAASPMEVEQDVGQCQHQVQPCHLAPLWPGFF